MLGRLTTQQILCIVFVLVVNPVLGRSYPQEEKPLEDILNGILGRQQRNPAEDIVRRQLDLGNEDLTAENWTGQWFPGKVTERPQTVLIKILAQKAGLGGGFQKKLQKSHILPQLVKDPSPESWTGRWFPEKVTEKPQPASTTQMQNNTQFTVDTSPESWTGRWFPEKVTEKPQPPPYGEIPPEKETDGGGWTGRWFPEKSQIPPCMKIKENSMWKMINSSCDDGKTNLTVDWSGSSLNYTCFNPHRYFIPDYDLPNLIIKSLIPKAYKAKHECMQREIEYPTDIPTFGTHRPAWPRYGEYQFVPRQRWIHSLEHGAIVFLYHPCAHPELVQEIRDIVTGCLFRHIITPYTLLPPERPLALLSWGWALLMSAPDEHGVTQFIREHALHGPEALSKDGQFSEGLIKPAAVVVDQEDSTVCPQQLF